MEARWRPVAATADLLYRDVWGTPPGQVIIPHTPYYGGVELISYDCDKCGAGVSESGVRRVICYGDDGGMERYELCPDCYGDVVSVIEGTYPTTHCPDCIHFHDDQQNGPYCTLFGCSLDGDYGGYCHWGVPLW